MAARNSAVCVGREGRDITKSARTEASHIYGALGNTVGRKEAHTHILVQPEVAGGLITLGPKWSEHSNGRMCRDGGQGDRSQMKWVISLFMDNRRTTNSLEPQ